MRVNKRPERKKKKKKRPGRQQFAGVYLGAYMILSLEKWCRKSPRPALRAASHLTMVAMIGGWIGRRRTIEGPKSDARYENGLVSTRMLGDYHASAVSVVPV